MDIALIIPAFLAGILTFLAPCTLPLVPGYLAFISGVSTDELKNPETAKRARRKIFLNGLLFVSGFSVIFILFGVLAGSAGSLFAQYRVWFARVGGIFVILFGFFMIGILKIPFLAKEVKPRLPKNLTAGTPTTSFILGSALAIGWTPCVGPILGSVLLLASVSSTALQGAFLLFVFSMGLAIPFLLIALGIGSASKYIAKISRYLSAVSVIGGVLLVALGVLLFTDNMALLVAYGFRLLQFINYDAILNYL